MGVRAPFHLAPMEVKQSLQQIRPSPDLSSSLLSSSIENIHTHTYIYTLNHSLAEACEDLTALTEYVPHG